MTRSMKILVTLAIAVAAAAATAAPAMADNHAAIRPPVTGAVSLP